MGNGVIAARATPAGKGGIGIIRLSGAGCLELAAGCFSSHKLRDIKKARPNRMYFGRIGADGIYDEGYFVYFPGPRSFTGEDSAEFQCHGGPAIIGAVLNKLYELGAKPAARGEFTKRAFLNGRLTLSDAEGVAAVIEADNTAALKAAYRLMKGGISKEISGMRDALTGLIAAAEAELDYPEELFSLGEQNFKILSSILSRAEELLASAKRGELIERGANVVLLGAPNTGKSSLLNRILKRDRAIVTDIPGTTRDTLEESIEYKGVRLNFIDTAGLREDTGLIEKKGIERSLEAARGADVILYTVDSPEYCAGKDIRPDLDFLREYKDAAIFIVFNKSDLADVLKLCQKRAERDAESYGYFSVSAISGEGIERLLDRVFGLFSGIGDLETLTLNRHVDAVRSALCSLRSAEESFFKEGLECVLVDLKNAWLALGEITGQSVSEEIIDKIFSEFCLGK